MSVAETGRMILLDELEKHIEDLIEVYVRRYMKDRLPELLKDALDAQRKTVADELVRILLEKAFVPQEKS